MVGPLSDRLSPSDLDILAGATAPTLAIPSSSLKSKHQGADGHTSSDLVSRFSSRRGRLTSMTAERASERPPLVPRRLRRLVNDRALHTAAAELGALPANRADLRALFERRVETSFSQITRDSDAAIAWAPFVELDEDEQRLLLAEYSHDVRRDVPHGVEGDSLNCVDRKLRQLLKTKGDGIKSLVGRVEDSVVDLALGEIVVLRLPHALSRMIAHGVAQFHRLGHRSLGVGADRVLVVRGQGHSMQGSCRLVDVLAWFVVSYTSIHSINSYHWYDLLLLKTSNMLYNIPFL